MELTNNAIAELRDCVDLAYNTIAEKGGEVPENRSLVNLPDAIGAVKPKLEELTITENGTYTPLEGVDGFSKVVARVVSTKRVVIPSRTQISNTQIIDGYWAGELVDTSTMTDMYRMFRYCSKLQTLDVSNWDVSGVTNMNGMFEGCSQLQSLDVSGWDTGNVTNMINMFPSCSSLQTLDVSGWDTGNVTSMHAMFYSCSSLQSLDVSGWNTDNVTNMYAIFGGCSSLQSLDVSGWNVSSVTNTSRMFEKCKQLQTLIGNRTIEDVIANNISALNGLKVALELYLTILDRASLRAVINGLADLTGQTTQTLRLGGALIAKITEEDIAIATAKNWTIA